MSDALDRERDDEIRRLIQEAGGLVGSSGAGKILGITATAVQGRHNRAKENDHRTFPRPVAHREGHPDPIPLWTRRAILRKLREKG